jgi:hypothetical protein
MLNALDPRPAPRRRRLPLRYLLGALAVLFFLPILAWLVWGWTEAARLDRALDALEARHEPLDIGDFDVKPTTPEQREASHLYAQARKQIADLPITSQESAMLIATIDNLCDSDAGPAGQADVLRAFENRYTAAFDLLDRASQLDVSGWAEPDRPRRGSIEEMQLVALARANVVRIARLACTRQADAAAAALFSTLRLRRMWYSGPVVMPTTHSLHAIFSWGAVSAPLLEKLQREFAWLADDRVFENWMLHERAYWLYLSLPGVFSDEPPGGGPRRVTPVEAIVTRLARPLRDRRTVAELSEYAEAIEIAERRWPQKIDAVHSFVEGHRAARSLSIIERLTSPFGGHAASRTMTSYFDAITEALARTRASMVAIAIERFRHDHQSLWPATLQQLVPAYLSAPLVDPYTGGEFHYWHDCGGFKVYSVGINRKDDGGTWEQHSDLQQSRRGNPADIGIEVGVWPRGCR